jgi:hypothetical protein
MAKSIGRPVARAKLATASPGQASAQTEAREINWAAVKRRYQSDRRRTVPSIADHYGLDPKLLRDIAREMGWIRPSTKRGKGKSPLRRPGSLRERLFGLMDGRITQMEMDLQDDHLPPRLERERRSSEFARLIRALGQAKHDPSDATATVAAPGAADDDQDRWRRELVERIRALKDRLKTE